MDDNQYDPLFNGSPLGMQLIRYLQSRDSVPTIQRRYLGDSTSGQFVTGHGIGPAGVIQLSHGAGPSVLTHELAHAADRQLLNQYMTDTSFGQPNRRTQFTDGFEKLRGTVANSRTKQDSFLAPYRSYVDRRQELASKLDPQWTEKNKDYRASNKELAGWGAGGSVKPDTEYARPNHLDSTMATELSILLDLAQRGDKQEIPKPGLWQLLFGK